MNEEGHGRKEEGWIASGKMEFWGLKEERMNLSSVEEKAIDGYGSNATLMLRE